LAARSARGCNLLHNLGNGVLLLEWGRSAQDPCSARLLGRPKPLPGALRPYFPAKTSLAMVASCMLDVPS
jgi:hypothetical protein